jgi:flagellar biosynthesis/type III secretory pathway protein FliH
VSSASSGARSPNPRAHRREKRAAQIEQEAGAARDRLRRLDALVSSAADAVSAWRGQSEEDIVALAHEIACRVVGDSVAQPEHLRSMARHVIRAHGARQVLEVRVNPDDFEHLQASEGDGWEWIADPSVGAGVLLRLAQGGLDARVESQLRAMTDALLAQRRARGEPRQREETQE